MPERGNGNEKTALPAQFAEPSPDRFRILRLITDRLEEVATELEAQGRQVADAREIIRGILSDPKIAAKGSLAERTYRDEPILMAAGQMANYTPPRIREMRRLAKPLETEAETFVRQGEFMADFEDDCPLRGTVVQYYPTYQALTDAQLRGYFTWRAGVRRGEIERTSLSLAFLHVYELLNGIGARSPGEGFGALARFRTAYRDIDPRIDGYTATWLRDYVVYHDLDSSLLDGLPDAEFDKALDTLLNHESRGADEVFAALNSLSSYDFAQSRFFRQFPDDAADAAVRAFAAVSKWHNRNPRNNAREKLFGRVVVNGYRMFRSAVFHDRKRQRDRAYEVGRHHRYVCENGEWSCERFVGYGMNNKKIGAILKTVDYLLRESRGFRSALQPGKLNKVLRGKIEKELARAEREKRDNPPVSIDLSKLGGIRAAALATRDRLLVDDGEEEAAAAPGAAAPDGPGLDGTERAYLLALLRGGDAGAAARGSGLPESVIIDSINGKCFDRFGDTVIACGGDAPGIVEDYRNDLKGMFPE